MIYVDVIVDMFIQLESLKVDPMYFNLIFLKNGLRKLVLRKNWNNFILFANLYIIILTKKFKFIQQI